MIIRWPRAVIICIGCLQTACAFVRPPSVGAGLNRLVGRSTGHRQIQTRSSCPSRVKLNVVDPGAISVYSLAADSVSAWSVTSVSTDLAANLFQASLPPYLAFLFFLSRPEAKTPKGGVFGFAFLLVFVFLTIPAGIYAKVHYNDILANIDWLHGSAESMLTLTNLLIVKAFRDGVMSPGAVAESDDSSLLLEEDSKSSGLELNSSAVAGLGALALVATPILLASVHAEPLNALSFPTWMVHVSSLIEWLAAMVLVWRYAAVSGIEQWKGLTWGMLPLHTSGLCACTFHIFYNSPELSSLVAVQAALTVFGNTTMAYATYRIWQAGKAGNIVAPDPAKGQQGMLTDKDFYTQVAIITLVGSAIVKWGELMVDFPFEPSYAGAAALILGPSLLNGAKWFDRSKKPNETIDGYL